MAALLLVMGCDPGSPDEPTDAQFIGTLTITRGSAVTRYHIEQDPVTEAVSARGDDGTQLTVDASMLARIEAQTIPTTPGSFPLALADTVSLNVTLTENQGSVLQGRATNQASGESISFVFEEGSGKRLVPGPGAVVIVLGVIGGVLCLAAVAIAAFTSDCNNEAVARCGAGNVASSDLDIDIGVNFDEGIHCTVSCEVTCIHDQGGTGKGDSARVWSRRPLFYNDRSFAWVP